LKLRELSDDENPRVRLPALHIASKCVGMQREVLESLEAPVIVIGAPQEAQEEQQDRQAQLRGRVQGQGQGQPGKVVEITR
jgi:hypothetical protein